MADHKDSNVNLFGAFLETVRKSVAHEKKAAWVRTERSVVEDPEARVLELLSESGPQPLGNLIQQTGRSLKTLLRVLERLERFGLVARQKPGESKPELYQITTEGLSAWQSYGRPIP